ncbi:MAG: bifunctional pyr operon transcriptional regulator/uracil phosphoribosyltransferase PyrR [Magnetococcus sp. WYHC-3]
MTSYPEETLLTSEQVETLIDALARGIHADITHPHKRVVIGIRRGGALIADRVRARLNTLLNMTLPIGYLDITFYRDDLDTIGPNPVVQATDLTMPIDDKRIILVDDVLFTGRTIRAAMNALFDYGRPEIVDLMVLVDRGHRQLPICPDYCGLKVDTDRDGESIKLQVDSAGDLSVKRRKLA